MRLTLALTYSNEDRAVQVWVKGVPTGRGTCVPSAGVTRMDRRPGKGLARAPHGTGAKKVLLSREGQEWAGVTTTGCPARVVVGLSGAGGGSGPGAAVRGGAAWAAP